MIQISALIVDYGGVISLPQRDENIQSMLEILGCNIDAFQHVYMQSRADYDRGRISAATYWTRVARHCGRRLHELDVERLVREDIASWTAINPAMLDFLQEIRETIPQLAILSNMTVDTLTHMRTHFQWLTWFDELFFSCDLGVIKPESQIYKISLHNLGLEPATCLFVDDSARNVKGARAVGMHAIQFQTFSQFSHVLAMEFRLGN